MLSGKSGFSKFKLYTLPLPIYRECKMKMVLFQISIIALFSFFLNGCNAAIDPDLVGDTDCKPPCWEGIMPGITNKETAVQILQALSSQGEGQLTIYPDHLGWNRTAERSHTIFLFNNIVELIRLNKIENSSMRSLIDQFGEPHGLMSVASTPSVIEVYYPIYGLAFNLLAEERYVDSQRMTVVSPNAKITRAFFLAPSELSLHFNIVHSNDLSFGDYEYLYWEWKGYGSYP